MKSFIQKIFNLINGIERIIENSLNSIKVKENDLMIINNDN